MLTSHLTIIEHNPVYNLIANSSLHININVNYLPRYGNCLLTTNATETCKKIHRSVEPYVVSKNELSSPHNISLY